MKLSPVGLAQACADEAELEREVLAALGGEVGFDVAFFAALGERPTAVGIEVDALVRAFGARAYDDELMPLKGVATGRGGVAVDTEVFGETHVRRTRYFRDFVKPLGGRHTLMAYLVLRGRPIGALMLGRCGSTFAEHEVRAIEELLPALTVARASFRAPWFGPPLPNLPSWWRRGERARTRERDVLVRDRDGYREMVAMRDDAELVWSRARLDEPARSGWFYVDLFHLAAARARFRRRVLFIGAGGAVGVRQFAEVYPGIAIDLVDIDSRVIELARDWYALGSIPRLEVHVADGFDFVRRACPRSWDVIIVDAYDASDVPDALADRPFFRAVRRALQPGGCVAVNTIGPLRGDGAPRRIERAMTHELDDVRRIPVLDPGEAFDGSAIRNVVILGTA